MLLKGFALALSLLLGCSGSKDSDFMFEEFSTDNEKTVPTGRTWIYDAHSDLCAALVCSPTQICLLEDSFTAVCVEQKDIKSGGDKVIWRSGKPASFVRQEILDQEVESDKDASNDKDSRCQPCRVSKPVFLCGTNNQTYSSLCRLDRYNCVHGTQVSIACKGFCPCPEFPANSNREELWTKTYKTVQSRNNGRLAKTEAENSSNDENGVCNRKALRAMGNRLLDWFTVLKDAASATENQNVKNRIQKTVPNFPSTCQPEVQWMFAHLDRNSNGVLDSEEVFDMKHVTGEPCMGPFLEKCNRNGDGRYQDREWCKCFHNAQRPCTSALKKTGQRRLGVYVPKCDASGYYAPLQCHSSVGVCWCVDKHGIEIANTRGPLTRQCETPTVQTVPVVRVDDADDEGDVLEQEEEDIEGSGDGE